MEGWIKIHRKMTNWEWYTDGNTFRLFIHLLINSNHAEKKWKGITVNRGQIITGFHQLSNDLNISIQSLRTSFKRLKSTNELTIKTSNKYSLVTILNYDLYQENDIANKQTNNQSTINQQTTNNQSTTNKNDKKVKNDKNTTKVVDFINYCKDNLKQNGKVRLWKVTNQVMRQFNARLREGFTPEQFAKAIEKAKQVQSHKDNNYQYLTPEFFTRTKTLETYGV